MKKDTGKILANCGKQLVENKKKTEIRKKYAVNEAVYQSTEGQKTCVCGIVSIICGCVGVLIWLVSVVGLILGVVAIRNPNERKGTAITGTAISAIAMIWPILAYFAILLFG